MAGYSGTPLPKKLGIKDDFRITLINAPKTFSNTLGPLPSSVRVSNRASSDLDLILFFVDNEKLLAKEFPKLAAKLATNGMIWIAWPKKSSGVATDLSFGPVQRIGLDCGLVDVKICAVDEVWSGLKFVFRLKDRVKRERGKG